MAPPSPQPQPTSPITPVIMIRGLPMLGVMSVIGGFLLQFTMGSFYSFGNMMTYMTSYMRAHHSPNLTYEDFVVVQSTWGMTQGTVMPISGFIIHFIGERAAMTIGSVLFSAGCALSYFTIEYELWMVAASYGFVAAFGQNIALIPTLTTAMKWFPHHKGTAMGLVVGGFGAGALIFNHIQTAIVNPDNISVASHGINKGYFLDQKVLSRVPDLLLYLSLMYAVLGLVGSLLVRQPPDHWLDEKLDQVGPDGQQSPTEEIDRDISWKKVLFHREFYLLWVTRLCVVLITQVVAALYKAFGQTFIYDDHFLSLVGAISSIFNCAGRFVYGLFMDKTSYKVAMSVEAVLLTILVATFPLTSMIGHTSCAPSASGTPAWGDDECIPETHWTTKACYAIWVWLIFLTFPGTYSMQPAVTIHTFGHKHGGIIYAFLFTSDIVNNLMVATLSKKIKGDLGYLGLFLIVSLWGVFALLATLLYPRTVSPQALIMRSRSKTPIADPLVNSGRDSDQDNQETLSQSLMTRN